MAGGSTLRGLYAFLAVLGLLTALCTADAVSDLQTKGRPAIDAAIASSTTCTKDKVKVRKEWYARSEKWTLQIANKNGIGAISLPLRKKRTLRRFYVNMASGDWILSQC